MHMAPVVGVGSVCRRQATNEGAAVFRRIAQLAPRLPLHAFGVKRDGLAKIGHLLASADSMAWSFVARKRGHRLPGCSHVTCANCYEYAQQWGARIVLGAESRTGQLDLL